MAARGRFALIPAVLAGLSAAVLAAATEAPRPPLRVLVSADAQPEFFSFSPGARPGLERELLEGFVRARSQRLEAVRVPHFDDVIAALRKGEGDVIAGIVDTPERREEIAFTAEVLPTRYVVVTRRPYAAVRTLADLQKERVGVVRGTTWEQAAREAGVSSGRMVGFPLFSDLRTALGSRRVTAVVTTVSEYLTARRRDPRLRAGICIGPPASAAWGVRQQDAGLLGELDAFLAEARRSGMVDRAVARYFGPDALDVLGCARQTAPATSR
jgi:ABC-type amino acid transport substrate-binding protein